MGQDSKIEWCDHTFNPWSGCTKVSPGCANCYAETLSNRAPKTFGQWGKGQPRKRTSKANWKLPLNWAAQPWICDGCGLAHALPGEICMRPGCDCETKHRARVFCASLADWLDDEVPIEWLADLLDLIRQTPNLDWLLLTKRPENWSRAINEAYLATATGETKAWLAKWIEGESPANVWIGTTVEDQIRANERIPQLIQIPARVRFLSCEPLLGPLDLQQWQEHLPAPLHFAWLDSIHWVIAGGESGPGARPMHPAWARSLRDQCAEAEVPFLFKQWGEWEPMSTVDGRQVLPFGDYTPNANPPFGYLKSGKKRAGRLLDGRTWDEVPSNR